MNMANPGRGRPIKYASVEELQKKIDEYFEITPLKECMITGLAVHLDTSRTTLMDYQERDEYFNTIKKAKDKIEMAYELRGMQKGGVFDIFRMKNMGWQDKVEQDLTTNGKDLPTPIIPLNAVSTNDSNE